MTIGVVVQARMGSTRLPGKTMKPIAGQPMISHIIERFKRMAAADVVVLAVTDTGADRSLAAVAEESCVEFFTGPEEDVLGRYYAAARQFGLDQIYRATGDNPLVDPAEQDRLVRFHCAGDYEYSETLTTYPKGLGGEIFSREGLERCWQISTEPHQREGVNDYVLEHRSEFRVGRLDEHPYPQWAFERDWTVDTAEQFAGMKVLYEALYRDGEIVTAMDAIAHAKEAA